MEYFDYLKRSGGGGGGGGQKSRYDVISDFHSVSRQPKTSAIIISL